MFWNHPEPIVVPPVVNAELLNSNCVTGQRDSLTFKFDDTRDFAIPITEEFMEHAAGKNLLCFYLCIIIIIFNASSNKISIIIVVVIHADLLYLST